jgi:hypothetical protein
MRWIAGGWRLSISSSEPSCAFGNADPERTAVMDMRLIASGGFFAALMAYVIFGALKTGRIERGGYIIDRRADPSRFRLNLWIAELVFLLGIGFVL